MYSAVNDTTQAALYRDASLIREVRTYTGFKPSTTLSFVVAGYRSGRDTLTCLEELRKQTFRDFDLILVDNGGIEDVHPQLKQLPLMHIVTTRNTFPGGGRNIGALHSRARLVAFPDNDAIMHERFAEVAVATLSDPRFFALRGRVLPKTPIVYNHFHRCGDLGGEVRPARLNEENAVAIERERFIRAGGWDQSLVGFEGLALSYRLAQLFGRDGMIYQPDAIVYHDSARSLQHFLRKQMQFPLNRAALMAQIPELEAFVASYPPDPVPPAPRDLATRARLFVLARLARIVGGRPSLARDLVIKTFDLKTA